jgi:hypothetical protein
VFHLKFNSRQSFNHSFKQPFYKSFYNTKLFFSILIVLILLFVTPISIANQSLESDQEPTSVQVESANNDGLVDSDLTAVDQIEQFEQVEMGKQVEQDENYYITMKDGFKYVHIEGTPAEIGYLHGSLLADYVQRSLDGYAHATENWYGLSWDQCRRQATTFWIQVPDDYQTEIENIAQGAADNGVTRPQGSASVDWIDILTLNSMWDLWWRVSPPGNPLWWWPFNQDNPAENVTEPLYAPLEMPHHCSAFVATGNATSDGDFVMSQSLWMPYFLSPSHAVFLDLVPNSGNRILMEVNAGLIWSGTEWYVNSAGLVIAETTLGSGPYNYGKVPSFVRLRKAVQYAESIDDFRDIMLENSNGAYLLVQRTVSYLRATTPGTRR